MLLYGVLMKLAIEPMLMILPASCRQLIMALATTWVIVSVPITFTLRTCEWGVRISV